MNHDQDVHPAPAPAIVRREPTRTWIAIGAVLVGLVVIYLLVHLQHDDGATGGVGAGGSGGNHAVSHRATVGLGGHHNAVLQLDSGADRIEVTTADLGGDLAEVTTPDGAANHPRTELNGDRLRVWTENDAGTAQPGAVSTVEIRIARSVAWDLDLTKGAKQIVLRLGDGTVHQVALAGGADHVDLTLPRPHGTATDTVTVADGLGGASLHAPDGIPVQVTLGGGAGSAVLDGATHQGIAAGTTLRAGKAAANGANRIVVTFSGGIGNITLDRTS